MSQLVNQVASASDPPVKRRRGRPRKDETQAQSIDKSSPTGSSRPILRSVSCTQGNHSTPSLKGKDTVQADADPSLSTDDDSNIDHEMVGQVVTGVLECAFDAGYFLRVRVGDSDMYMRGVVFKEGCVVPVTPENDIAPYAKMYTRRDLPIPDLFTPHSQTCLRREQTHSLITTSDVGHKREMTETVDNLLTVLVKEKEQVGITEGGDEEEKPKYYEFGNVAGASENVLNQPEEKKTENEASNEPAIMLGYINVNVSDSNPSELEKDGMNPLTGNKGESSLQKAEDLDDLAELSLKIQKTDEATEKTYPNAQPMKEEEENECEVSVKDISGNPGFQISMENGDALLTEQACEASAMETG